MDRLSRIREAEKDSHIKAYTNHELYAPGSWLAKPVKTVLDLLPMFEGYRKFRALDLGSGVGRNSIPVAQNFAAIPCRVECVDILEMAIEKLIKNARAFGVEEIIHGIISPIDHYTIEKNHYDLIMAISALEHVDSKNTLENKLMEIRDGIRKGGIACLILNTGVQESRKDTGEKMIPQFEVNLQTEEMRDILHQMFDGWHVIKNTVVHQRYDIPRGIDLAEVQTDVVTYVVRKEYSQESYQ